jgi:enamine deaminase RidA (YjgF/YER057c/UK114 family)
MVSTRSSRPGRVEEQLKQLGVVLPNAPHPLGAYVEAVQSSNLLFLSGMLPVKDGKLQFVGRLGRELDESAGRESLRTATLNALSAAKAHVGSLDRVTRVVSVKATWQQTETFTTSLSLRTQHRSFSAMYLEMTRCPCGPY